ncbi:hypothetical protein [Hyphococcus sp.]|uniref:hypothetical protein n=1 Tax=Hyphococcus sp. TaxID=2038636 RepID=UPI0037528DE5
MDAISRAFAESALIPHEAAAALLGVDRKTLKKEGDQRRITFAIVGARSRRYAESDVRDYVAYLKRKAETCRHEKPAPGSTSAKPRPIGNMISGAAVFDFLEQHEKRRNAKRANLSAR